MSMKSPRHSLSRNTSRHIQSFQIPGFFVQRHRKNVNEETNKSCGLWIMGYTYGLLMGHGFGRDTEALL